MPDGPDADGAEISRRARDFLGTQWQGQSLMAIGAQDPVLGPAVMQQLRASIRGCPEPIVLPHAMSERTTYGCIDTSARLHHCAKRADVWPSLAYD